MEEKVWSKHDQKIKKKASSISVKVWRQNREERESWEYKPLNRSCQAFFEFTKDFHHVYVFFLVKQLSTSQTFIRSPLIAEALAMRSALCIAQTRGISSLRIFTDNSTLLKAISGKYQSKEIIGVVHDIRVISSDFASILFSYFSKSKNTFADALAKASLQFHLL